jgi:hypothetical protein
VGRSLCSRRSTQPAVLREASYQRRMPNSTSPSHLRQTKDVLLIEPPSTDRDRHAKTLARHKYKVTIADTVEHARGRWTPARYGLVVMSVNGAAQAVADFCGEIKDRDSGQVIALIFHPDHELPATDCPTLIFTTEPDEYFLARVETLTAAAQAA